MTTIAGGTVSQLSGGKFANGAVSSAFVWMYNKHSHESVEEQYATLPTMSQAELEAMDPPLEDTTYFFIPIGRLFAGIWKFFGITETTLIRTEKLIPTHEITMSKRQFRALKTDISENGIQESISYVKYNGKNYIVDGHHRFKAARQLGIENIPAKEVSLPFRGYKTFNDLLY